MTSLTERLANLRGHAVIGEERQAHSGRRLDLGELARIVETGGDMRRGKIREFLQDLLG